jgi:hypothetical protein
MRCPARLGMLVRGCAARRPGQAPEEEGVRDRKRKASRDAEDGGVSDGISGGGERGGGRVQAPPDMLEVESGGAAALASGVPSAGRGDGGAGDANGSGSRACGEQRDESSGNAAADAAAAGGLWRPKRLPRLKTPASRAGPVCDIHPSIRSQHVLAYYSTCKAQSFVLDVPAFIATASSPCCTRACAGETRADHVVQRYWGHRNRQTVKGVNFYGASDEFVVSGSDCGNVFVWRACDGELLRCGGGILRIDGHMQSCYTSSTHLATAVPTYRGSDVAVPCECMPLCT